MASEIDMLNLVNFKTDPLHSDVDDDFGLHSDIEQLPTSYSLSYSSATDYWFGKKYFELIVAQEVFHQASHRDPIPFVDAQFEQLIRSFSYSEARKSLQTGISRFLRADCLPSGKDEYYLIMSLAGLVARKGTAQEKHFLIATVKNLVGIKIATSERNSPPQSMTSESNTGPVQFPPRDASLSKEPEANSSKYTSLLKDRADLRGIKLDANSYYYTRSTDEPDTFKAILTFQGCTFEGRGRTKKGAKHEASKEACKYLDGQAGHMQY